MNSPENIKNRYFIKRISDVLLLFFIFFFFYGLFVNKKDQTSFTLQQAGVEALVERGTLYLEGSSTPELQKVGDVFRYNKHKYPAKQPGQFFISAIIYFVLHFFGITYQTNYLLTSSLVSWFTSGLMTSLMVIMTFRIAMILTKKRNVAFFVSICYGLSALAFPYSGSTCPDLYGAFFIFASFYFLILNHHTNHNKKILYPILSGAAAGLAVFCSMLPLFILVVEALYILSFKRKKEIVFFILGCAIAISPLLIYNFYAFGNPFITGNIAGNFKDTYPTFSFDNVISKLHFYFIDPSTSISFFSPIVIFAFFGIFFLPRKYLREKLFIIGQFVLLTSYLSVMTTVGHCGYGPRYLIPVTPFLYLGLCSYWIRSCPGVLHNIKNYRYAWVVLLTTSIVSALIAFPGALYGVMHCNMSISAFRTYLGHIISGKHTELPLFNICTPLLFVACAVFAAKYRKAIVEYLSPLFKRVSNRTAIINRSLRVNNTFLLIIIALACFLRIIFLSQTPTGLYPDEASIGYSAYSVAQSGRDVTGRFLPLYFSGFGDFKDPIYIYSIIPLIKLFGLNEFVIRLTSALFGVLTVIFTYLLTRELFNKRVALWAALFLSISPWHLQFSRIALEPISLPCFFTISVYFLVKGLKSSRYLFWGSLFLALCCYTYPPARLFVPLFFIGFFWLNYRALMVSKQRFILSIFISALILSPLFTTIAQETGHFNNSIIFIDSFLKEAEHAIIDGHYWLPNFLHGMVDNKTFLIPYLFLRTYLLYMSPAFLFLGNAYNFETNAAAICTLYKFEYILLIVGIVFTLLRKKKRNIILLWWFIIFAVPSCLTYEGDLNTADAVCGLPVFQILAAIGLVSSYDYFWKIAVPKIKHTKNICGIGFVLLTIFIVIAILNIQKFGKQYYIEYAESSQGTIQNSKRELLQTVTNRVDIDYFKFDINGIKPEFILFYTKQDPVNWIKNKLFTRLNFKDLDSTKIGKYATVADTEKFPSYKGLQTILDENGNQIYVINEFNIEKPKILDLIDIEPKFIGGLKGSYFNGLNFNKFVDARIDREIDFKWDKTESPFEGVNKDRFSIQWKGYIRIDEFKKYEFYTISDDGVRLIIDGEVVIENWTKHGAKEDKGEIYLKKGWHEISIGYFDAAFDAKIKLLWNRYSIKKTVVPSTHLSFYDLKSLNDD